ncbi:MAG: HEAT repeat domain-containing protein [Methylococcaceae bacterium]|nr:HEAT repeat domain-containing protein [Methylococcaceae bacterium]
MKQPLVFVLIAYATGLPVAVTAEEALTTKSAYSRFVVGKDKGVEFQLEARRIPLAQVLDRIAEQTQIPIHYSVLPEGLVTATCAGATFKQILACLLDHKADLIVRYKQPNEKIANLHNVAEAWVLGSRLDVYPVTRIDCIADAKAELALREKKQQDNAVSQEIETLLARAKSKTAAERADAIGALLGVGRQGDATINAVLEEALHDDDASVRAQAISTLSHLEGASAKTAIQEALHDISADVRRMAVDGITDDIGLLQEAINDSDESIRDLAAMKLEDLMKQHDKTP